MKKIFLTPALLAAGMLCAQTTYVAPWQDISTFTNSSSYQHGGSQVFVDAATGNVFAVGTFENSISIGSFNLTSSGSRDIYVAKYNSSGTCLKAIKLGGTGYDEGYTITYRDNYAFVGAMVAGDGTIYKLDDDATPLDVTITRSLGYDVRPRSLYSYGLTGKILVGGSFIYEAYLPKSSGTIYLEGSNITAPLWDYSYLDCFAGIMDMNCYFTYASNPDNSTGANEIMSIWGRNGRIYCTGYFRGDMKWASTSATETALSYQDAFVAGVYITTSINQCVFEDDFLRAGSSESVPSGPAFNDAGWRECGYGICANGTAIYVTGCLNNGSSPTFGSTAYTGAGAFVARVNYNGSNVGTEAWVRTGEICGQTYGTQNSIGYGVAVDALGNIFATGRANNDVEFDGGANADICIWTAGGSPGFISKYESDGDIISADAINKDVHTYFSNSTEGRSIVVNGCEVFTTGWTQTSETFQAGNLAPELVGTSKCAMYIFELGRDVTISDDASSCISCATFPLTMNLAATGGTSYSWAPSTYLSSSTSATPTYSLTSCSNSGTTNYVVTITNTVTGCNASASLSVTAGSLSNANAGSDQQVCPNTSYTLGTAGVAGLTYSWAPTTYLTGASTAQPTYYNTASLSAPKTYTLTVTDACGNVTTDQVTLTNDPACPHRIANPNQPNAEVFPNPSTGIFNVNLTTTEEESNVEFVVTDLSGRVVQQSSVTTSGGAVALDLSSQAAGVYMLSVTRNGVTEMHKLIIE